MSSSGTSPRRKEDARLLTGQGRYVSDLALYDAELDAAKEWIAS